MTDLCSECKKERTRVIEGHKENVGKDVLRVIHTHPCSDCGGFYLSLRFRDGHLYQIKEGAG